MVVQQLAAQLCGRLQFSDGACVIATASSCWRQLSRHSPYEQAMNGSQREGSGRAAASERAKAMPRLASKSIEARRRRAGGCNAAAGWRAEAARRLAGMLRRRKASMPSSELSHPGVVCRVGAHRHEDK